MTDDSTLPDTHPDNDRRAGAPADVLGLVVVFCAEEPERAGEIAIPPPGDPGREVVWGRAGDGDGEPRLLFQRQRPGRVTARGELASPRVSRVQLRVRALGTRAIAVSCVGKTPLLVGGRGRAEVEARPGDVIEIGKQIAFLCVRRPAWIPGRSGGGEAAFGAPDANGIVGESPLAWELRRTLALLARSDGHVLVLGPSGSGKELCARALHAGSSRAGRAMVARSAATLPEGLIDAELFGNAKNYPQAGMPERAGVVGEADGSTLFLDEIGEIPASLQAHLLRLLDAGEYHRLGEPRARRADVRVIAATNRAAEALKHDLVARFALEVRVPGLEERREDIPLIANHLLRSVARADTELRERLFVSRDGSLYPRLSPSLARHIVRAPYDTHVRELLRVLRRSLAVSEGDRLEMPSELEAGHPAGSAPADATRPEADAEPAGSGETGPHSAAAIQAALDANNGALEATWRALALPSRHALARLIKRHGIEIRRRPR